MSLKGKGAITGVGDTRYSRHRAKASPRCRWRRRSRPSAMPGSIRRRSTGSSPTAAWPWLPRISSPTSALRISSSRRPRRSGARAAWPPSNARSRRSRRASAITCWCRSGATARQAPAAASAAACREMPQFRTDRRVRDAARRHRAGAALRADGAPAYGALRHDQPATRRDRRLDAGQCDPQRQCDDDEAADDRGSSCFPALLGELLRRGYSDDDVRKVAGGTCSGCCARPNDGRPPPGRAPALRGHDRGAGWGRRDRLTGAPSRRGPARSGRGQGGRDRDRTSEHRVDHQPGGGGTGRDAPRPVTRTDEEPVDTGDRADQRPTIRRQGPAARPDAADRRVHHRGQELEPAAGAAPSSPLDPARSPGTWARPR